MGARSVRYTKRNKCKKLLTQTGLKTLLFLLEVDTDRRKILLLILLFLTQYLLVIAAYFHKYVTLL